MFHPFFFHQGFDSCHFHDMLADAMALAAALKVEQDLQDRWNEEREDDSIQRLMILQTNMPPGFTRGIPNFTL